MNEEAQVEFVRLLAGLQPVWILCVSVAMILAAKVPQMIKEIFVGIRGLRASKRRKDGRGRKTR